MTQTSRAASRGFGWGRRVKGVGVISWSANVSIIAQQAGGARQLLVLLVRDQYSLTALRRQAKRVDYCTLAQHVWF